MKNISVLILALHIFLMTSKQNSAMAQTTASPAHVSNSFHFVVQAPFSRTAALFGPEGERCWAGEHWNSDFLYPQPAKDVQGAVFTVQHGPYKSVWVNMVFDRANGRMQYVSFVPDKFVFTVEVQLTVVNSVTTSVEVTYTRTALDPMMNEEVQAQGIGDRGSAAHWQKAIESCLRDQKEKAH